MQHMRRGFLNARTASLAVLALAACGGPSSNVGANNVDSTRPRLETVQIGRLVDIYAYQRIDEATGDRRNRFNRRPVLVARDVVVNANLETQSMFDPGGDEVATARFEFRPFDIKTGHEDLLILWDNRGVEAAKFDAAFAEAQSGLQELAPSYRGQNTSSRPIPVVPRNAALVLQFSSTLTLDQAFFQVNPSAVQLLEFKGDPAVVSPVDAFRAVPFRVIPRGRQVIVDPTILGGENTTGFASAGMPASVDNATANIRLAIPSRGSASSAFYVREDGVPELNSVDSFGRVSVCRDFRSGNAADGTAGIMRDLESPMIVGSLDMGIASVDAATGVITLNKRAHNVPVRGRFPFVDGVLSPTTGLPLGPAAVPTILPLRSGDFLIQDVQVTLPTGELESVRVRAEILQNLDVGTVRNDPAFPGAGLAADGSQGENASVFPTARVRVASLAAGTDSLGRPVSFQASTLPNGADCILRAYYYERLRYLVGGSAVSDAAHRDEFLRIDPKPAAPVGTPSVNVPNVDPAASYAVEFSEPMDFDRVDNTTNFVVTNASMPGSNGAGVDFATLLQNAKTATAGIVPTRLTDQSGDGTVLQLTPPQGLFHMPGQQETYWVHLLLGSNGMTDLSGNQLALFGDTSQVVRNWSVSFGLNSTNLRNLIGWKVYRFEDIDEDGTLPGSIDIFGQYRLIGGRLVAAETLRFSRNADSSNLGTISRILRGECWDTANSVVLGFPQQLPYVPGGGPVSGQLYLQPRMVDVVNPPNVPPVYLPPNTPQPVGHVVEPHQPRGSRMMMRYLEDDFDLSSRQASDFMLDVEQLYWSPFNDENVLFDVFDRYTMSLAHGDRRPDQHFSINPGAPAQPGPPPVPAVPPFCQLDCPSISSSLSATFLDNPLQGTVEQSVLEDKTYTINPNQAFRSPFNIKYVPYPKFDRTYTWRDSRLVTIRNGDVSGLTGAHEPQSPAPNNDWTANMDSPWIKGDPPVDFLLAGFTTWVRDDGDFRGDWKRDHDPIAAPLVVDFKVFPDSAANGIAKGTNGFQVAMMGPASNFNNFNPGGYYNVPALGVGCPNRDPWPRSRVHSTGGLDPNTNQDILVDPANSLTAIGGWVKDSGAIIMIANGMAGNANQGIFQAPPGDGMINWAQADFVRKVSSQTFGFIDTLQPNVRVASATTVDPGFPDFRAISATVGNVRIADLVTQMDPPQSKQPAGTSVVLELRGASTFANAVGASGAATTDTIYNPAVNDTLGTAFGGVGAGRGNLLNPNYACEAYRYSKPNGGAAFDTARVAASGLTPYVTEDRLSTLREASTGLLPRFLNLRLIMTNNVSVSPAVSPSLRSLSVIYRMQPTN